MVALRKPSPDSLKLQVLVHRVDVKQQNECSQSANPFSEISPVGSAGFGMIAEERQKAVRPRQPAALAFGVRPGGSVRQVREREGRLSFRHRILAPRQERLVRRHALAAHVAHEVVLGHLLG